MRNTLSSALCATAILLSGASTVVLAPAAQAQVRVSIGFNFFHDRLASSGRWIHHPVWGDVWRPRATLVGADFQPYTNGHWEYTDEYGWYWMSDDAFDDVVYHYGRWVYDPQYRWLWVPGYTWAPAWVAWREGEDYTGWMPLPPDEGFMSGTGVSFGVDLGPVGINFYRNFYGSRVNADDFFVFVGNRHLVDRDYRRFVVPRAQRTVIINRTRTVTKFEVVNNRVVNRGIDVKVVERATGRRIAPVSARTVIKSNDVITTVDEGKEVRARERTQHPVNVEAFRKARAGGSGENPGGGKPNGNGSTGADNNPAAGNTGAATGGNETTGKRKRHQNDETASPSGATGANSAGQSDENTTSAPGESPKKERSRSKTGESTSGGVTGSNRAGPSDNDTSSAGTAASGGPEPQGTGGHHRRSQAGASESDSGNAATDNSGTGSSDQTGGGGKKRNRANDSAAPQSSTSGAMTGPGSSTPDQSGSRSGSRMRNPGGEAGNAAGAPSTNGSSGSSEPNQPKKKKKHPDANNPPSGSPD
jgi:hypothetical protein